MLIILKLVGHFVAQVRLFFQQEVSTVASSDVLVYVQPFEPASGTIKMKVQQPERDVNMFRVVRCIHNGKRKGLVVKLTDLWRPVELVPVFGKECPASWTTENAVELAQEFYVNSFSEKETYQAVY